MLYVAYKTRKKIEKNSLFVTTIKAELSQTLYRVASNISQCVMYICVHAADTSFTFLPIKIVVLR